MTISDTLSFNRHATHGSMSAGVGALALLAIALANVTSSARGDEPTPSAGAPAAQPEPNDVIARRESGLVARRSNASPAGSSSTSDHRSISLLDTWTVLFLALGLIGGIVALRQRRRGAGPWSATRAVQILARTPLSGRQSLCLVRMGRTVLLLGVTPDHVRTLAQVNDPVEAAALIGAAESSQSGSLSRQFMEFLSSADRPFAAAAESTAEASDRADSPSDARRRMHDVADRLRRHAPKTAQ